MIAATRWLYCGLLALALVPLPAVALEHRDVEGGWTLRLPDGWRQLTEAEFAELVASLPQVGASERMRPVAGFRPTASEWYPTLLVSELVAIEGASLESLAKTFTRLRGSDKLREAAEAAEAGQVELGKPEVDERRKLVFVESRLPAGRPDEDDLVTLIALLPGRSSVAQLTMYCAADVPQTRRTFDAILDTFQFDPGRGYAPRRRGLDGFPFVLLLAVLAGALYRRKNKRRERGWPRDDANPEDPSPPRRGSGGDLTGPVGL